MNKEGLAQFAWGLLFPIPPPFYSDPSCVVSGKPVSYPKVEFKAHRELQFLAGSSPKTLIPADRHNIPSSFCLSGNHTIAGGIYTPMTSSTHPLPSYLIEYLGSTPKEGASPSNIVPVQIAKRFASIETLCASGNVFSGAGLFSDIIQP